MGEVPVTADALLLVCGNVRTEAAQIASPSIVLPDPLTWDLSDQNVQKIGDVSIGSDLKTSVSGETVLNVAKDGKFNVQGMYLANVTGNYKVFVGSPVEINSSANDLNLYGGATKVILAKGLVNLA